MLRTGLLFLTFLAFSKNLFPQRKNIDHSFARKSQIALVDSLNQVADSLIFLRLGSPQVAAKLALTVASSIHYSRGKALAQFNLGQVHRFVTNDFEKANAYYDSAIVFFDADEDYYNKGRSIIGKAAIKQSLTNSWKARETYFEAYETLLKGNNVSKSIAYELLAYQFGYERNKDSVFFYLKKTFDLQKKIGLKPMRIAYTLGALCGQALTFNDTILAQHYISQLFDLAESKKLTYSLAQANFFQAQLLSNMKKPREALPYYLRCIELDSQLSFRSVAAASFYQNAAECMEELGKHENAIVLARKSILLTRKSKFQLASQYVFISKLFEHQKFLDSALFYARLSSSLYEEVSVEDNKNLREVNEDYQNKIKAQNSYALEQEIMNNNLLIFGCLVVFILFSILIYIQYISRKRLKQFNYMLVEKNNEIATQAEEIRSQNEDMAKQNQLLEASHSQMQNLDAVGKLIISRLNVDEIIDTSYHHVCNLMSVSSFGIALYDSESESLVFSRTIEDAKVVPSYSISFKDKNSLPVWSFLNNSSLLVHDLDSEHQRYLDSSFGYLNGKHKSVICCPLSTAGKATGVLVVQHYRKGIYTKYDLDILNNISNYVSIAVENARSHEIVLDDQVQLAEANALKEMLISIISHDLKSPLNSLNGFLSLLRTNGLSPDETQVLAGRLSDHFNQTIEMVEGVLQWTRSQMGGLRVLKINFNPFQVIEKITSQLREQAKLKNLEIINLINCKNLYADPNTIELVIRNLISNSIKFTNPNGKIIISCDEDDERTTISIRDTGVGIPSNLIDKLFKLETRFSTPGTNKEKGTGLGLYLCKEFIEKMMGRFGLKVKME